MKNMIEIKYPARYRQLKIGELKKECMKVFEKKFADKTVTNKATGAVINLRKKGAKHALFARTGGFEKVICIIVIDKIIREATLESTEIGKGEGIVCVLRFKTVVKIDSKKFNVIAIVRITKEGKMYYDHILVE